MKQLHLFAGSRAMGLIYYSFFFIYLFSSCSKSEKEQSEVEFYVLEYTSNAPLSGVYINFYRCSKYDVVFGCQQTQKFSSIQTDVNGRARVSSSINNQANRGILLTKHGYFDIPGREGTTYMHKEATVPILLIPKQNYLSHYRLFVFTQGNGFQYEAMKSITVPGSPLFVALKIVSAQQSAIHWEVRETFGGIGSSVSYNLIASGDQQISMPVTDTLRLEF